MAKSQPGKVSKGKGLLKWTSQNQTQNTEIRVTEVGFFCSHCNKEWLEPRTDSSTLSTISRRLHQEEGCREQVQRKEEKMKLIGFYCESCNQRLLLREWEGNNTNTERHRKTDCHLTEKSSSAKPLRPVELTGYYCNVCKQEWLLTEDASPSQRVVDGIRHRFHMQCNGEINREVKASVIGYYCHKCQRCWQLKEWNRSLEPTSEEVFLPNSHKDREFLDEIKRYEEHSGVILYSCPSCEKDFMFKEWYGNPIPNTENALRDHHHKTGCRGTICAYRENDYIIGYFCSYCKKEWLLKIRNRNPSPDINYKPVDHHFVPMFCCLQVSDTGHYVKWKNINKVDGLTEGDHVVWPRCIGYWHHGIVEKVNDKTLDIIEWNIDCNGIGIKQIVRKQDDLCDWICCSYMYKVIYPEEVLFQNPAPLVLSRARARLNQKGFNPIYDNCEHFATFCKTGCHQSAQIFRLKVNLHGWLRRFVASLIHLIVIVTVSELVEGGLGKAKDWIGVISLIVTEILYLLIVVYIIYHVDTTRIAFKKEQPPECSKVCRCATTKVALQSFFLLFFAIVFSVFVKNLLVEEGWTELPDMLVEICLGILGGGIGNMVGFWFYYCPCCCCRRDASEQQTRCCCPNTASKFCGVIGNMVGFCFYYCSCSYCRRDASEQQTRCCFPNTASKSSPEGYESLAGQNIPTSHPGETSCSSINA